MKIKLNSELMRMIALARENRAFSILPFVFSLQNAIVEQGGFNVLDAGFRLRMAIFGVLAACTDTAMEGKQMSPRVVCDYVLELLQREFNVEFVQELPI